MAAEKRSPNDPAFYSVLSAMPVTIEHAWGRCRCGVTAERVGEDLFFKQDFPAGGIADDEFDFSTLADLGAPLEPRQLRDDFLAIRSESDAIRFLEVCGPFRETIFQTSAVDIPQWQEFYRLWMLESSKPGGPTYPQHFHPGLDASFEEENRLGGVLRWEICQDLGEPVQAIVSCHGALEVIAATITLDLLSQTRFHACLWCGAIFEVAKENGRQFCKQDCAHRAGQKRRRAAARKLRTSESKVSTDAIPKKGKD